jgi:hypothetical protein
VPKVLNINANSNILTQPINYNYLFSAILIVNKVDLLYLLISAEAGKHMLSKKG